MTLIDKEPMFAYNSLLNLYFRLTRFRQPNSLASSSETGLTTSLPSSISTEQGAPILNGKAVSSLIFVGT